MMRRFIIRPEVEADLIEAYNWYEECLPDLGGEFLHSVDAIFESIRRNPQQYPIVV